MGTNLIKCRIAFGAAKCIAKSPLSLFLLKEHWAICARQQAGDQNLVEILQTYEVGSDSDIRHSDYVLVGLLHRFGHFVSVVLPPVCLST